MTIFLSFDVEATGPAHGCGELASIGFVPVLETGEVLEEYTFYSTLFPRYYDPQFDGPIKHDEWEWNADTFKWWNEQEDYVYDEAFIDIKDRKSSYDVAQDIQCYARGLMELHGDDHLACVAHPAVFDWQWLNSLMHTQTGANIFGYNALCLRSMGYGLSQLPWKEDVTDDPSLFVESLIPHHALMDAIAQALTLSKMIEMRNNI